MAEEKLDRRMQTLAGAGPLAVLALLLAAGQAFGSDIHLAVRSNNMTRVESIIETEGTGVVCSVVGDGVTPLHLAAALNFEPMAAVLLSWGAKVDQPTSGGFTPLHWAASRNSAAVAKLLISRGASVNAATPDGIAPLHWAASHNATHVIGILLAAGADPGARTKAGLTPLHWAVMKEADGAAMALASNAVYSASGTETNDNGYLVAMAEMASDAQRANMVDADAAAKAPEAPANAPAGHGRAVPGAALYIPLGQGETLPFLWMKALGIWAGEYEVTNGQFRRFRSQHTSLFRDDFNLNGRNQPCVYVSWVDAQSFCDWLNRNFGNRLPAAWKFRLPSDREWVALARCGDSREYPWGNQWPPNYGNYSDRTAKRHFADWKGLPDYDDGHIVTCPVTESGTNEWGLYGMGGNVWEWCDDWYDPSRKYKVRHGGSWEFDGQPALRVEARGFDRPTGRYACVGFRVVAAPSARIMN